MSRSESPQRLLALPELQLHATMQQKKLELLLTILVAGPLFQQIRERLCFCEHALFDVVAGERQGRVVVVWVTLLGELISLKTRVDLAHHVGSNPAQLDQQLRA